jgi:hypothetical protein
MNLFRTIVFFFATSCIAIAQASEGGPEIPAGVKYKTASDAVNAAAKSSLEKALAGDKSTLKDFLSDSVTCGPMLWQTLKPGAAPVLLNAKPVTMVVTTPIAVTTEGRALVSDEARQTFGWH